MCEIEESKDHCIMLEEYFGISLKQRIWLAFLATRRDTFIIPTTNCLGRLIEHSFTFWLCLDANSRCGKSIVTLKDTCLTLEQMGELTQIETFLTADKTIIAYRVSQLE